jgi:hypothetical protein
MNSSIPNYSSWKLSSQDAGAYGIRGTNTFSTKMILRYLDVSLDSNYILLPFCVELSLALRKACNTS